MKLTRVASFNGDFCDECLNVHRYLSREDAREKIAPRQQECNRRRCHPSLTNPLRRRLSNVSQKARHL
ncbi:transposase [Edwardsiella hoshinae]|uniref:integrase core domain-containing protein n=1 Tax=Edwardsiella hoshinae TaxID=93378 RepID=UPI000906E591|nr:transposase [Edwardsiella hoshinae]